MRLDPLLLGMGLSSGFRYEELNGLMDEGLEFLEDAMRRICYVVAMSLDGFIDGPDGESDWIIMDPEIDFSAIFQRFDTLLMGRRTYESARKQGGGGSMPGMTAVVVSRTLRPDDCPGVTLLAEGFEDAVARLREAPGKDIWLFGGGTLFRGLLEARLVDTIELAVVPVLLGSGTPLLPPPANRVKLRLLHSRVYEKSGIVSLEYTVEARKPARKSRVRRVE